MKNYTEQAREVLFVSLKGKVNAS